MLVDELKSIEVLIRYLITNDTTLENEILSAFDSEETFEQTKSHLFNYISINTLIANYSDTPSFSLEDFLNTGVIPKIYTDMTLVPSTGPTELSDYKSFYHNLIEALKANNFVFDVDKNIFISTADIEATIPQIWLYRLGQGLKRDKYDRLFLYNKTRSNRITNKESLLEYLRSTKTFLVSLSAPNPNADYDIAFSSATSIVNQKMKNQPKNKIDDMIDLFKESVPDGYRVTTRKYRLSEEFWIIKKAEQLGESFYNEPLSVQESYINKWVTERVNCNSISAEEAQKYILLASTKKTRGFNIADLNKKEIIAGLFALYVNLISTLEQDLSNVSLSDFKIKQYMDEKTQNDKIDRRALDRQIAEEDKKIEELTTEAIKIFDEIKRLDLIESFDRITELRARYSDVTDEINSYKRRKAALDKERKPLNDIASLAFDNERIMTLINEATTKGQIYVEGTTLTIELHNNSLSEPVFKTTININKLLNFIEDVNLTLEELGSPKR